MKTLYESILDIDTPNRLENDVKTGIKRQKLIQEMLKPIEDIIKMYHYSTQGGITVTPNVYGLKGDVTWYEFESTGKTAQDKKGVSVFQNILEQAYRVYNPKNKDQSNTSIFPTSQFTFENIGISIFICFTRNEGVIIRLCYQSNNKQAGKYVQELVDKYTEPF